MSEDKQLRMGQLVRLNGELWTVCGLPGQKDYDAKKYRSAGQGCSLQPYARKGEIYWVHQMNVEIVDEDKPRDFSSARVGDRLWIEQHGYVTVTEIDKNSNYPIKCSGYTVPIVSLTFDGREHKAFNPVAYWSRPTITGGDVPPKRKTRITGPFAVFKGTGRAGKEAYALISVARGTPEDFKTDVNYAVSYVDLDIEVDE